MTQTVTAGLSTGSIRFAGYAAIFDVPDAGADVIVRGAFSASLAARRAASAPLPLFWQHRPHQQIGWVERCEEDARGLRVIARLADADGASAALLKSGEVTGLSFGYRARAASSIPGAVPGRELSEIEIFEISLVTNPMQAAARVHLVL